MSNASDFIIEDGILKEYRGAGRDVVIPDGVTSIGDSAFSDCENLTSITIPESVTSIGDSAFSDCENLTSITIPEGVTSIGNDAFYGCKNLADANGFIIVRDVLYDYTGSGSNVIIPASVTSIGDQAFFYCSSLTSIIIPEGVTSIGFGAFSGCSYLTCITIPASVTSIGNQAFRDCSSLTSIIIPEGVTSIGDSAFEHCSSLTSITIPASVTSISNQAFHGCKALADANGFIIVRDVLYDYTGSGSNVIIPEGVTSIDDSAFYDCSSLTSIIIPEGVTSIGDSAFEDCSSLTSIAIPEGVTSIGDSAFSFCSSLTSIAIPGGVTNIGRHAFSFCSSLTSITIPDSVTSIGDSAFYDCSSLTSITIPEGVTSIGNDAFQGCSSLTSIIIPEGVTSIDDSAFWKCSSLTSIIIPEGVTSIGSGAFWGCSSLTSITIPDNVTSIGNDAFYGCSRLTRITIPNSVTSIGDSAFRDCKNLTSITIPEGATSIGSGAFSGCSNLTSISIPTSATSIGDQAFLYCSSLTSIIIPKGVTSIGDQAFSGCENLTSVTIPDSVISIGEGAFDSCSKIASFIIPDSVRSIGSNAFSNCGNLKQISLPSSECKIGKNLFGEWLPKGLIPCVKDWYMRFSDGELKKYVLVESVWSKLDVEQQVEIYMNRCTKTLPAAYMKIIKEPDALGEAILARISEETTEEECNCVASFLSAFGETTASDEIVRKLYDALKPLKAAEKALKTIEENTPLHVRLNGEVKLELSEAEQAIMDILQSEKKSKLFLATELKKCYSLESSNLPRIDFADGTQSPDYVMSYLLTAYEEMTDNAFLDSTYEKQGMCENARKVVPLLDSASLQSALLVLANENLGRSGNRKKMNLAYPICRYADENTMNELLKRAPKWRSGSSGNDARQLRIFRDACLYNECRSVIMFADKYGDLDKYAKIRGTDAQTIRDTILADFGFDSEGRKTYDIGGTTIVVTLEKDCSLSLFDTKNDKVVKSIPKRGNDEALVANATKDYADLKKNVKKVVKNRFALLFSNFLKGTKQSTESWQTAYINNPLLRTVANIVVWQQEEKTFILKGSQAIHADGTPYTIGKSPILVAHPMEMTQDEISEWQEYFLKNSLKQPFEQVWEPVIQPDEVKTDRYAGVGIPYFRFLKQDKHGISVVDYDFHNDIEISFAGCNADVERIDWTRHMISPNDRFEVKSFTFKEYTRQVNHIVAYLDKASIYNRVINDDKTVAQYLHNLTLAQLSKFIDLAAENNCPNVSAILLEYKNENYKDADTMAEFTLGDW